jgi:hypothetical protein
MANDNTILSAAVGSGDTLRDFNDTTNIKWPAAVCCYIGSGSANAWVPQYVDLTHGMPIQPMTGATFAVTGAVTISAALPAGTNLLGKVGIDQTTPGTTNAVQTIPGTSGGLSMSRTISANTTNATSVKGSAGQLYHMRVYNLNASPRYLKFYNKATAPTVGTDTPVATEIIPGNTAGAGFIVNIPDGLAFSTGIAFALTTGLADNDTGAVAANEIIVNLGYK